MEILDLLVRGPDLFYVFWPVALSYLRFATHPRVFTRPLSPEDAASNIDDLLAPPLARTRGEVEGSWDLYRETTAGLVVRGNLVPDAHLVALMRQHGVGTDWTHDRDFRKFDGTRVRNPFA